MKTVREIMNTEVTTLGRNDTLKLAQDIMNLGRVRHFPVLEDGEVVGVMSQRDLYKASLGSVMKYGEKAQREFLDTIAVKEVMKYPPVTITSQASVQEGRPADAEGEDWLSAGPRRRRADRYRDRDRHASAGGGTGLGGGPIQLLRRKSDGRKRSTRPILGQKRAC